MKMRKEWWYVIALVVVIVILMIIFRDKLSLAPAKDYGDASVLKDIGLIKGSEKYSRTQVKNSQSLVNELKKLGAKNG